MRAAAAAVALLLLFTAGAWATTEKEVDVWANKLPSIEP